MCCIKQKPKEFWAQLASLPFWQKKELLIGATLTLKFEIQFYLLISVVPIIWKKPKIKNIANFYLAWLFLILNVNILSPSFFAEILMGKFWTF
jgi:hypothetical protein